MQTRRSTRMVQLVKIELVFSNSDGIPDFILHRGAPEYRDSQQSRPRDGQELDRANGIGLTLGELIPDLHRARFEMVSVIYTPHTRTPEGRYERSATTHRVRTIFGPNELAIVSEQFAQDKPHLKKAVRTMFQRTHWESFILWQNPYLENGRVVPDAYTLRLSVRDRIPRQILVEQPKSARFLNSMIYVK